MSMSNVNYIALRLFSFFSRDQGQNFNILMVDIKTPTDASWLTRRRCWVKYKESRLFDRVPPKLTNISILTRSVSWY